MQKSTTFKQPSASSSLLYTLFMMGFFGVFILNAQAKSIVRTDFNRERVYFKDYRANEKWVDVAAVASNSAISAKVSWGKFGTIDVANTQVPSEALVLSVENPTVLKNWSSAITSGLLAAANSETNPGKLTLSFDHWVSTVRPVVVSIASFNAEKKTDRRSRKNCLSSHIRIFPSLSF